MKHIYNDPTVSIFSILPYDKKFLIDENTITEQKVYIEKSRFGAINNDQYFIKICKKSSAGKPICQAYIYFYIDFEKRSSSFIGLYVEPHYREQSLAQLLISYWVRICFNNGIFDLTTIPRQRKPFILYLLKKFKFDLLNPKDYETALNTISICKSDITSDKCLYFKNPKQAETFNKGSVKNGDNYHILDSLEGVTILDQVLLSTPYTSQDEEMAYVKSLKLIRTFKEEKGFDLEGNPLF